MSLTHALSFSPVYDAAQYIFGAHRLRRWFLSELLRPKPSDRLFEAGCGTGSLLQEMPPIASYSGYDISEDYVTAAQRRFPQHQFVVSTAEELLRAPPVAADVVFCVGLLHHLDDSQVGAVLELAARKLESGGRMVALEPCFLRHQTRVSRWLISQDRGKFVREVHQYRALFEKHFGVVRDDVVTGLNNIPYVHLAIEATHPRSPVTKDRASSALGDLNSQKRS